MSKKRQPRATSQRANRLGAIDISDPANQHRIDSKHYEEYYANRAEMHITNQDARILFQQILGIVEVDGKSKALVQAKTTVTMTHAEFKGLCLTMKQLVDRNPQWFENPENALIDGSKTNP